jgi:hypothetical protein
MCREWKDTRDKKTESKLVTIRYESTHKHCTFFRRNGEHTSASEIAERMWPERGNSYKPGVEKDFHAANANWHSAAYATKKRLCLHRQMRTSF